jgi:glutathione synthase/RimK-type ligase-like ATP-grasp enzyme
MAPLEQQYELVGTMSAHKHVTKPIVLPRQKRNFTCGIAAIATAAQLLGAFFPKGTILNNVGAKPKVGTDHNEVARWSVENLPVHSYGEATYHGGLAVANITNKDSSVGHFVTLLGEKDGIIRYWCPLIGEVVEENRASLNWKNSDGSVLNWSVNFESDKDFYNLNYTPERHVFFIGDPLSEINVDLDTSLSLKAAYESREQSTSWHTPDEIFTKGAKLFLSGVPVLKNDIVWLRCDFVNKVGHYEFLRRLCNIDANFVNSPQAILTFHDKLTTCFFQDTHKYYTVSSIESLKKCCDHLAVEGFSSFVVKSPTSFQGKGVALAHTYDEVEALYRKFIEESGYVIVQGLVDMDPLVDTRVSITPNKIVNVFGRKAQQGEFLCSPCSGGTMVEVGDLSEEQSKVVENVQTYMKENDIFFVGLDFLGDVLTEVNISCTGGIRVYDKAFGASTAYDLIDECNKHVTCGLPD